MAAWVGQTPREFVFSVKASRYLRHIKRLVGISEGIRRFYEPLEPLVEARRLGPVLWQLPENFLQQRLGRLRPGERARVAAALRRLVRTGFAPSSRQAAWSMIWR